MITNKYPKNVVKETTEEFNARIEALVVQYLLHWDFAGANVNTDLGSGENDDIALNFKDSVSPQEISIAGYVDLLNFVTNIQVLVRREQVLVLNHVMRLYEGHTLSTSFQEDLEKLMENYARATTEQPT